MRTLAARSARQLLVASASPFQRYYQVKNTQLTSPMNGVQWLGRSSPQFVLVSDLDHTMVENEDPTHSKLLQFNQLWLSEFSTDSCLIYSTGRSPVLYKKLWSEAPLITPDILICSVGTEIYYRAPATGSFVPDSEWEQHLSDKWDRKTILHVAKHIKGLVLQDESEQRRFKVSFKLKGGTSHEAGEEVVADLKKQLEHKGIACKVIFSAGVDIDVLAQGAGKGAATAFILQKLASAGVTPAAGVQVNGDSGNDAELFTVPGVRGCVVGNAHPELLKFYEENRSNDIYKATQHCSAGIVEALHHFGTLNLLRSQTSDPSARAARGAASRLPALHSLVKKAPVPGEKDANGGPKTPGRHESKEASEGSTAVADLSPTDSCTFIAADGSMRILPSDQVRAAVNTKQTPGMWVDHVTARALVSCEMWLATYVLWQVTADGTRDCAHVRQCAAVLKNVNGGVDVAVHVQETPAGSTLCQPPDIKELSL